MARKLRTKPGRAAYARRKAIVEPVFSQIMTCQNGRELLLRGETGDRGEWRLLAACHNLRKIFRHTGSAGLAAARASWPGGTPPDPPDTTPDTTTTARGPPRHSHQP